MKCYNCGYESRDDFAFCAKCGAAQNTAPQGEAAPVQEPAPTQANTPAAPTPAYTSAEPRYYNSGAPQNTFFVSGSTAERVLTSLKDSLFLILCIAYSVSTAFLLFDGGVPVIEILITIFLWITFAKSRNGIASREHIRCISGTIFASYVVNYVIAGSMAFAGLVVMIFGAGGSGFIADILQSAFREAGFGFYNRFIGGFIAGAAIIFGIVLIVGAAVVAVINYFSTRSIHLFVQSVYNSIGGGQTCIVMANTAKTWLMVLGILDAVGAVASLFGHNSSILQFIALGAGAAAKIIGSILIEKYYNNINL